MDDRRFDALAKAVGAGSTRRRALAGLLGGALAAIGGGAVAAKPRGGKGRGKAKPNRGNSDCAHFCNAALPPGPARGECKSDAAHGKGPCVDCDGDLDNFCGGECVDRDADEANCGECGNACGTGQRCCGGECLDVGTDANCSGCGDTCAAPAVCHDGACCTPRTAEEVCTDVCSCAPQPVGCGLPDADCGLVRCPNPNFPNCAVSGGIQVCCDRGIGGGECTAFICP